MDEREYRYHVGEAAEFLQAKLDGRSPKIGIILGSGLGALADQLEERLVIPYQSIPYFPVSTVAGHEGRFVAGKLGGKEVLCMQGRFHYYEGYHLKMVTMPVRVMKLLGIETLIVTNAAGGINTDFKPGDLMLITDHINMIGENPLIGPNWDAFGSRFFDMTTAYDPDYRRLAEETAISLGFSLQKGVYAWMSGPCYETPAEIRFLQTIGADAVGMSTVPEVIVARHAGMRVLGVSCITNMAAGITGEPLNHEEVTETADRVRTRFESLITQWVSRVQ